MVTKIRKAELNDIEILHNNLRQADIKELSALGSTPLMSLLEGFSLSNECYSIIIDNKPEGMFGISIHNMPEGTANIWCLGTDKLATIPKDWLKLGRFYINKFLENYSILTNHISIHNKLHIRWLEKLGASFSNSHNGFKQFIITKGG